MIIFTPSRLHLGFIDPFGKIGRIFGSVGVAIEKPGWVIEVKKSDFLRVEADSGEAVNKIKSVLERAEAFLNEKISLSVKVLSSIPFHKGLGAGTQLSLAISEAVLRLFGVSHREEDIVRLSGRGRRSGVGIMSYFKGGFNLDAGKKIGSYDPPLLLFHIDFPPNWLFLVVYPHIDLDIHGKLEDKKFELLKDANVFEISHLILMGLLPSLLEKDIESFGKYLTLIQRKVGEIFSLSQGGIFAHDICEKLISLMLEEGAYGAGQSSWGPVVYGLVEKGDLAEELKAVVEDFMKRSGIEGESWLSAVSSKGRRVVAEEG